MTRLAVLAASVALTLLAGCEMLGIESPETIAAAREAEGKAIGAACRHAARAIEDCYTLNKRADKAAMFAGWRDMNDYMRENKMEPVAPELPAPPSRHTEAKPEKSEKGEKADKAEKGEKADAGRPADVRAREAEPAADKPSRPKPKDAKSAA